MFYFTAQILDLQYVNFYFARLQARFHLFLPRASFNIEGDTLCARAQRKDEIVSGSPFFLAKLQVWICSKQHRDSFFGANFEAARAGPALGLAEGCVHRRVHVLEVGALDDQAAIVCITYTFDPVSVFELIK